MPAGFAVVALKFSVNHPDQRLRIVPCGIHHNQSHMFNSRLGLEFGKPIEIPPALVMLYKSGKQIEAVHKLRDLVQEIMYKLALPRLDDDLIQVSSCFMNSAVCGQRANENDYRHSN